MWAEGSTLSANKKNEPAVTTNNDVVTRVHPAATNAQAMGRTLGDKPSCP